MAEKFYKITGTKRLDGVDNYGNVTDSIYVEGETDSALWKHSPETVSEKGTTVYGEITNEVSKAGNPWRKFTKKQVPEDVTNESSNAPQTHSKASQGTSTGGDGARQGMAINNAANYVIQLAVSQGNLLSPDELADEIRGYAKAIYKIDVTKNTDQDILDMMSE